MNSKVLLIKNMVCRRCVLSVEEILNSAGVGFHKVIVGEAHLLNEISADKKKEVQAGLEKIGLGLIDTRQSGLIEKVKKHIIAKARNEVKPAERNMKLSEYLTSYLHHEYTYLSSLFSNIEGRTIENYFIEQRIEKAKELLVYGEFNLSEIAIDLDYSSVGHLSSQFKKITGLTPSHFKSIGETKRKTLDQI